MNFFERSISVGERTPRLFRVGHWSPLWGVMAIGPQRKILPVYDISSSGMVLGHLNLNAFSTKSKPGERVQFQLLLSASKEPVLIQASVEHVHSSQSFLAFSQRLADQRLMIEQTLKEEIILDNLRVMPNEVESKVIASELNKVWIHGPFDTNFVFDPKIGIFFAEFDGVIRAQYLDQSQALHYFRSNHLLNSKFGTYFDPVDVLRRPKTQPGIDWPVRLKNRFSEAVGLLAPLIGKYL
jgi:hypothetical protein